MGAIWIAWVDMGGHMSCYGWAWVGIGRCWWLRSGYGYKFEGKSWALIESQEGGLSIQCSLCVPKSGFFSKRDPWHFGFALVAQYSKVPRQRGAIHRAWWAHPTSDLNMNQICIVSCSDFWWCRYYIKIYARCAFNSTEILDRWIGSDIVTSS